MSSPGTAIDAPAVVGPPPERPFSWRFTTPLFIGSALNPINSSLIATALIGSAGVLLLSASAWIGLVVAVTVVFGIALGAAAAGNQTALYRQAPAEVLGTASGLLRTFGYLGSIGASAITGIVFHTSVSDHGLHDIAWIMVGVSVALVLMTITDRTLRTRPSGGSRPVDD